MTQLWNTEINQFLTPVEQQSISIELILFPTQKAKTNVKKFLLFMKFLLQNLRKTYLTK